MTKCSTAAGEEKLISPDDSPWLVYLLRCADGTLYAGVTSDMRRRLRQHNGELKGGARYTQVRRPATVVWTQTAASRSEAQRLEAALKKLGRREKLVLIKRGYPLNSDRFGSA